MDSERAARTARGREIRALIIGAAGKLVPQARFEQGR